MLERQYSESSMSDESFTDLVGFRPIVLYDTRVDMVDESLTLSRSARAQQLPQFSTLSSRELDEIDSSCLSSQQNKPHVDVSDVQGSPPPQRARGYAAGDELFNYRALGSLRSGLAPIALFSRWHAGLALTAFASGAASAFVTAGYHPLLFQTLNDRFNKRFQACSALVDWPGVSSVLLGLFSDCVPVYGTRRKAYIMLGWAISAVCYASGCALYLREIDHVESPRAAMGSLLEAFSAVGCFALQLSWVSALALVVGFGQRENLRERGGLATLFLVLWQFGVLVAHLVIAELQASVTLPSAAAALATMSALLLPCVCWFLHDDDERESAITMVSTKRVGVVPALRTGVVQIWEICQEKVTYRVLFFLLLYGALLHACDPGVDEALAAWSGFTFSDGKLWPRYPWIRVVQSAVAVVALLHAKWRLLSTAWRPLAITGCCIASIGTITQAIVIATDTVRTKWFFSLLVGIVTWPETWLLLLTMLSTTELAHVGCEGVTIGLVLSFQSLGKAAVRAIAWWISRAVNTDDLVGNDAHSTRTRVILVAAAYAVVNLLAGAAVPWLPRTKLEAQQLRAFGGYSRRGAAAVTLLFGLLLALAVTTNLELI